MAAAIGDRDPQQAIARGFILKTRTRKVRVFLCCYCCDRRSRPATGHRQGLYPENPHPKGAGFSLLLLLRSEIATRNRSPPGALSKKASLVWEGLSFYGARHADVATNCELRRISSELIQGSLHQWSRVHTGIRSVLRRGCDLSGATGISDDMSGCQCGHQCRAAQRHHRGVGGRAVRGMTPASRWC